MAGKNTIVIKPGETAKLPRPEAPEVMPKKTAMWKDIWRSKDLKVEDLITTI